MIRAANISDISVLIKMGRKFHAETCTSLLSDFDDKSFGITLESLIGNEDAIVMVYEENGAVVGMAGAIIQPLYFNRDHRSAQEIFCWLDPDSRGHGTGMFEALELWAVHKEAKTMIIALVPNMRATALDRIYCAKGYMPTDKFYTKRLSCQVQ